MQDAKSLTVREICEVLDAWAPSSLQADYDNSGLLVGRPDAPVTKVLTALDCTEALIAEAQALGAECVVVHHPIIFKGLKRLTGATRVERIVMAAMQANIAVVAAHTNLDHVSTGVSRHLAELCGCEPSSLNVLQPLANQLVSLTFYTPISHADEVEEAVFAAGGGQIGHYDQCAFRLEGRGSFRPLDGADPFTGKVGERTMADERRSEIVVSRWRLSSVLKALKAAHPYEEVAHQVVAMEQRHQDVGAGMVGELPAPMGEEAFLDAAKSALSAPVIRHTELLGRPIRRVAVCGGSGSFLLRDAIAAGADVYVTGDFKYHEFQEADGRILIADVGHFESEWRTVEIIQAHLTAHFKDKFPNFAVHFAQENHNPVHYR